MCYCVVTGSLEVLDVPIPAALEEIGVTLAVHKGDPTYDPLSEVPEAPPWEYPTKEELKKKNRTK